MQHAVPLLLLVLACNAHGQTDNCEPIRLQIESRFRAGGVANPALVVLPAGSARAGRVVGTCGNGSRQIVLQGTAGMGGTGGMGGTSGPGGTVAPLAASPAVVATDKIPTECKDGSIVIGPRCDDPRAVRMTSAELAAKPASQ